MKFRHLVERAKLIGADCLATGHYARIERGDPAAGEPHRLLRAVDPKKDQSYVLYTLTQEQLGFIHFPLGGLHKTETRALARAFDLPVAEKAESQEICFVGKRSYADFVAERRPDVTRPGEIVDTDWRGARRAPRAGPPYGRAATRTRYRRRGAALRDPPGAGSEPPGRRLAG